MRRRAFTLTEVLLALIVVAIVGGALFAALFAFLNSYNQTEDYTVARERIEEAFQTLSAQMGNVGLGMPNNRGGQGSFVAAFAEDGSAPKASIMTYMGEKDKAWGGPITVASGDLKSGSSGRVVSLTDGAYVGAELYYAWAEPTGVLISSDFGMSLGVPSGFSAYTNYDVLSKDKGYWTGNELVLRRAGGMGSGFLASRDAWIVFPSFGAPLWVKESGADYVRAVVAPGAKRAEVLLGGVLHGFEEMHRVRVARLYVKDGDLVQEFYDTLPQLNANRSVVLVPGVAGVWFRFDPQTRNLNMSLAVMGVHGDSRYAAGRRPSGWPDSAPDVGDGRHRILVETMTWRMRN